MSNIKIHEDLAFIRAKVEAMDERQDNWFKLLQDRIPTWDIGAERSAILMKTFWVLLGTGGTFLAGLLIKIIAY